MSGFAIPKTERQHLGEALIVYIYRALNKPKTNAYFHVKLLDVLLVCAKEPLKLSLGIHWANGTSCIRSFTTRSRLDDHPNAPQWAASQVFAKGETFALLSKEAIDRIRAMSPEKRRQLEAIAADLFPDHEAIRGDGQLFAGAKVAPAQQAYFTSAAERHVEQAKCGKALNTSAASLQRLQDSLNDAFADPDLAPEEADQLQRDLEDLLIGRLELEQPTINVELLARVMARSLQRLGKSVASAAVGELAQKAATLLAVIFPVLSAPLGTGT
jgi:hypothetical protein